MKSISRYLIRKGIISQSHKYRGFTLVELLISVGISGVIGGLIISILFTTLRVSKKSDLLITLKHTGNSVLAQVSKQIRYAKSLDYPSTCIVPVTSSSVTVTSLTDTAQTTFSCESGGAPLIASNGASLIDNNSAVISNCTFSCTQPSLNDPPTIKFSFTLSSKNPSNLVETRVSVPFQTSVTLRNYSL